MDVDMDQWLKKRPRWLQTAVARLFRDGHWDEEAINELVLLCKHEAGIELPDGTDVSFEDLPDSLPTSDGERSWLSLVSIAEPIGINALAPRTPLSLGGTGLTVVYGTNGSGKSGYVRVLKEACGARHREPILENVFKPTTGHQECTFTYAVNGEEQNATWRSGSGQIPELSRVQLYDSDCANLYVRETNTIEHQPGHISLV